MEYQITKGKQKQPWAAILYSDPGMGKSSFGASCPKPIFFGMEETKELEIDRYPKPKDFTDLLNQFEHFKGICKNYKTIVLDTLDSAEMLAITHVLSKEKNPNVSLASAHGGYGKGYDILQQEMARLREKLIYFRDNEDINILLLAHPKKKTSTDLVLGMTHDSTMLNVHEKVQTLFVDYVQCVFFVTVYSSMQKDLNSEKVFSMSEGERRIYTEKRPSVFAKNRFGMPAELAFDKAFYNTFDNYYQNYYQGKKRSQKEIADNISVLIENIADVAMTNKIKESVLKAKTIEQLEKIENRVRELIK